jgi:hypothetical protein
VTSTSRITLGTSRFWVRVHAAGHFGTTPHAGVTDLPPAIGQERSAAAPCAMSQRFPTAAKEHRSRISGWSPDSDGRNSCPLWTCATATDRRLLHPG